MPELINIPLNQPSKDIVLALVNAANNASETFTTVQFSAIEATPVGSIKDTSLVVTPLNVNIRNGQRRIYYNRIDIATLFQGVPFNVVSQGAQTSHDLIDSINAIYGLQLQQEDVLYELITEGALTHMFKIAPGSYAYKGQALATIIVYDPSADIDLDEVIVDGEPDGF